MQFPHAQADRTLHPPFSDSGFRRERNAVTGGDGPPFFYCLSVCCEHMLLG